MTLVSGEQLRRVAPKPDPNIINSIVTHGDAVFAKYGLTTLERLWGFFSVAVEETGGLRALTEDLDYSAERAHQIFPQIFPTVQDALPFAHNQEAFANRVYGHRMGNANPGDGWLYRGQGLIQITGHDNFALLQNLTGLPLLDHPELVIGDAQMLECAVALFVRYQRILAYCDQKQWHAVWALVGSGSSTGRVINLDAHENALAAVQAAITSLGPLGHGVLPQPAPAPPAPPEPPPPGVLPQPAPAPAAPPEPPPPPVPPAPAALVSQSEVFDQLLTRLENAIARIPRPSL